MQVAVVVPSYRRPEMLRACVRSLLAGERRPDEIVVAGREGDQGTRDALRELQAEAGERLRSTWVTEPGHIPPVRAGAQAATTELVALVDDDVTVTPEWLREIVRHFDDPGVGAAGGHVVVPGMPPPAVKGRPGHITWYGKHWGNVGSLEAPAPLDVMSLMEGNWAWRRELFLSLDFDPVLNFDDASMYGLDLCFQARRRRYRVVYDARALVYHHAAPRIAELDRQAARRRLSYSRNYTYILLRHLPPARRVAFLLWWFLIGERGSLGLGAAAAEMLRRRSGWLREFGFAWMGKIEGVRLWLHGCMNKTGGEASSRTADSVDTETGANPTRQSH